MSTVSRPSAVDHSPFRKVLSDQELVAVQEPFRDGSKESRRTLLALQLGLGCGLRSAEIAGARWGDLDLAEGRIYVRGSVAKGGRPRAWYLSRPCVRLLELYRENFAEITPDTPVFPSRKGGRPVSPSHMRALLSRAFEAAGVARPGLSSHSLRHSFATRLYKQTRDVELVRRALGHSKLETTQTYLRGLAILEDRIEDVRAVVEGMLTASREAVA